MKHINVRRVFLVLMFLSLGFTMVVVLRRPVLFHSNFLFADFNDSFMDFFNSVYHGYDGDPYRMHRTQYPPFCYVIYYFIGMFVPRDSLAEGFVGYHFRISQYCLVMFIIYMTFTSGLLMLVLKKLYPGGSRGKFLFCSLILVSAPFIYEFERANIIIISFIFLALFVLYKDSKNRLLRELSLIALALSAGIKIYPAAFGLLLLKEKRWGDAVRCIIYGLLVFLVPFYFMGGLEAIQIMMEELFYGSGHILNLTQGEGYKVSFSNIYITFSALIHKGAITEAVYLDGARIANILGAVCAVAAVLQRKTWKVMALLAILMVGYPGYSYQYCLIFMVMPLTWFFKQSKSTAIDYVYAVLFAMMFALLIVHVDFLTIIPGLYPVSISTFIEQVALMLMFALLVLDTLIGVLKEIRHKSFSLVCN